MELREGMAELRAEIEEHCIEVMGEHGGRGMAALARRGYDVGPAGPGDAPAGLSRLGGAALLEPGTPWPEVEGIPLSLLAVLDVEALAPWLGEDLDAGAGRAGLLNVFYLEPDLPYEEYRHIDAFDDARCWRVIPADPARAVETPAPAPARVFAPRPASAEPVLTLPGNEEAAVDALDLGPGNEDVVPMIQAIGVETTWRPSRADAPDDTGHARHSHRAFGWPWPLQGAIVREGEVHLLQLDSDDQWQWGDMGVLYFLIPADALRAGDFSQVRVQMDCC